MRLIPKRQRFYELFRQQSDLAAEAARLLAEAVERDSSALPGAAERIRAIEHDGDATFQEVLAWLRKTFITPLDPEDIHRLAEGLDDVLDDIEECAFHLTAYRLEPMPTSVVELLSVVCNATAQLALAVRALERNQPVQPHIQSIRALEKNADEMVRTAVVKLFSTGLEPIPVLQQKEILEWFEAISDRCEDVADVLENIVVKNA